MRKVLPIFFLVLLLVAGGAYCISWFVQASEAKKHVEAFVAKINEKQQYLTYESISTGGFPSELHVVIHRPHFTGRIDTLLKELPATRPSQEKWKERFAQIPEWSEDIVLDGHITLGINALSSNYTLLVHGDWTSNSKVGAKPVALMSQSSGDSICRLQLARGGLVTNMWNFSAITADAEGFFKDFRMFDCIFPNSAIVDATSKAMLMQRSEARVYITSTPAGVQQNVHLSLKTGESEFSETGDAWIHTYAPVIKAFNPYAFIPTYSKLGKQSAEVDVTFSAPSDWGTRPMDAPFEFNVGKYEISSAAYTASANFSLSNSLNGDTRLSRLAFRAESTVNELYDQMFREYIKGFIQEIYATSADPEWAKVRPTLDKYTPEQLYAIVYPTIPSFHSLGKMVQALDMSYQGNKNFTAGDTNLATLELSFTPYGITGQGTAKRTPDQMIPTSNIKLACANCLTMIDDAVAYTSRVQQMIVYFDPQSAAAVPIDQALVNGVKNLLSALAVQEPNGTFTYSLVSDQAGISVNGKDMMQLQSLYNEHIRDVMRGNQAQ